MTALRHDRRKYHAAPHMLRRGTGIGDTDGQSPSVHKICIEVQSGAGQGRESSLKARPDGSASCPTADDAQVAQLVEQGTENPRVGGSNPSLGTISQKMLQLPK
jgi:hypothetical protein